MCLIVWPTFPAVLEGITFCESGDENVNTK